MIKKYIKKFMFSLGIVIFSLIAFSPVNEAVFVFGTTKVPASAKPVFTSSFIQSWYCKDFDQFRWKQELIMLQKMGINEIIIQAIANTGSKYAAYPTSIPGYRHNDVDMLENVLTVADSLSMNVRIGLAFNDDWWDKQAFSLTWLNDEASINKAIVAEVVKLYGRHPSLSGWYIPHEFSQITAPTIVNQSYLNSFFKQIASEIRIQSPGKDIMISPFYNSKYSKSASLTAWSAMVRNIIKGTGIDILALQDAVGVEYNTTEQLEKIFYHTKRATDAAGVKLYSVTETFTTTPSGNATSSQNTISTQLSVVKSYVQGFVAFSINHYQNANVPAQLDYSDEYYDYYLVNR